ncbi:MAG: group II truncated hemoglobin [Ghiorsea sp.]|nr:group II truncated hemoglobin [Ghiorsea sp.]MDQ7057484.1 group II truncated hemoglobin [Ghiorsea sp.]
MSNYGFEDVTYKAVGGYDGLVKLVDDFYDAMETLPEAKHVRDMHPKDLDVTKDKLVYFLSGWMGGPRIYPEKYGRGLSLPMAHQHLKVTAGDAKAWLSCMQVALDKSDYPQDLKDYLMEQLAFPANRINEVSQMAHGHTD